MSASPSSGHVRHVPIPGTLVDDTVTADLKEYQR
jgi:hypothetical protein